MGKPELVNLLAEATYNEICNRAKKMAYEEAALPSLNEMQRLCLEAGIAAGVTAAIKTFGEAGLFK